MKKAHRFQEWLADRVSWVQYPNIKPADDRTREAEKAGFQFVHKMTIGKRIDLFLCSSLLLIVGIACAVIVVIFCYLVITTI